MRSSTLVVACVVATLAFATYSRTLLPGVDLGDTGGFQAAVLWPEISARQAYPLYYALAKPFVGLVSPANPARGLNLFSAACGAVAAGLLTFVVAAISGSVVGGATAGLLLAFSYTFWSQAIIAEVYTLHLALVGVCLLALLWWSRRPSSAPLAAFFAIYALAFGNHLSTILLLIPFAAFLLLRADRAADLLRPRVVALALAIAAAGALQYLPNLLAVWTAMDAPERWLDRLAAFWFDVTKSDWRSSMVLGVRGYQFSDHLAMFGFDARQQFGLAGLALAAAGAVMLWRLSRPWAALVALAYGANTIFSLTYNVGDPHVFFLPGHYFTAFAAGVAVAALSRSLHERGALALIVAVAALGYAGWRGYDTWPAVDRHADRRAEQLVSRLTLGLDERTALLAAQLNWQVENALLYESRYSRPQVVWTRLSDVLLHFPLLVRDNQAGGRDVVLTAGAVRDVSHAFGPLLPVVADPLPALTVAAHAARVPRGTRYVLTILPPTRDQTLDDDMVRETLDLLTGGRTKRPSGQAYELFVGTVGDAPSLHRSSARPFRETFRLPEGVLDVRMDGWVPLETFRRAGFGHAILDRRRLIVIERGLTLGTLGASPTVSYAGGLYEAQPRYRIPQGGVPGLALLH